MFCRYFQPKNVNQITSGPLNVAPGQPPGSRFKASYLRQTHALAPVLTFLLRHMSQRLHLVILPNTFALNKRSIPGSVGCFRTASVSPASSSVSVLNRHGLKSAPCICSDFPFSCFPNLIVQAEIHGERFRLNLLLWWLGATCCCYSNHKAWGCSGFRQVTLKSLT